MWFACITQGLRENLDVGLQYMEAWLRGVGCVPIHNLMEDAATAEISRYADTSRAGIHSGVRCPETPDMHNLPPCTASGTQPFQKT